LWNGYASKDGFTGHEHIYELDLIHMKGRVYDPTIGRFLQADVVVQSSNQILSYNRYAYVWNNPLAYVDPTGYVMDEGGDDISGEQGNESSDSDLNAENDERHFGEEDEGLGSEGGGDSSNQSEEKETEGKSEFEKYFEETTGMSVEDALALYQEQTGKTLTKEEVERMFVDPGYAKSMLMADKDLHTVFRGILNSNIPLTAELAEKKGYKKLSYFSSYYHDPANNTKWVGPNGHMEAVYDKKLAC
jgi:RHS repeat-associated protein